MVRDERWERREEGGNGVRGWGSYLVKHSVQKAAPGRNICEHM
jgi:hypothetical protein